MFDKIAMIDNKIAIVKWIIEWEENLFKNKDKTKHTRGIINETDKTRLIESLTKRNIDYKVTDVDIPEEMLRYDGMQWNESRDKALLMINGDSSYQIEQLEQKLDKDYRQRKRIDGEYTEEEWEVIAAERRGWRSKLRELLEKNAQILSKGNNNTDTNNMQENQAKTN